MATVKNFIVVCFKKIWCQLPDDGEIRALKQAGAM
jgi:hypothetical protein